MVLDDIVDGIFGAGTFLRKSVCFMAETAIHHPVATGFLAYASENFELMRANFGRESSFDFGMLAGVSAFVGCRLAKTLWYDNSKNGVYSLATGMVVSGNSSSGEMGDVLSSFLMGFVLSDSFLGLRDYQRRLENNYVDKNLQVNSVRKCVDFVLERPVLPSSVASAGSFAYFQQVFSFGYGHDFNQALMVNGFISASFGLLAYFGTLCLAGLFHSQSTEYAALAVRARWKKLMGDFDSADSLLSRLESVGSVAAKTSIAVERADLLIARGKYDEGMLLLKNILERKNVDDCNMNPVELLYLPVELSGLASLKSVVDFFSQVFVGGEKRIGDGLKFYGDNRKFAADFLLSVSSNNGSVGVDSDIFYFLFLNEVGDKKSADRVLKKIVRQYSDEFSVLAESCNVVLEYDSSALSRAVVFKSGSGSFKREFGFTELFYDAVGCKDSVARPLGFVGLDGGRKNYFALSRIKGSTVAEIKGGDVLLQGILELLCDATLSADSLVGLGKRNVADLDYGKFFFDKFVSRVSDDVSLRDELRESGEFMVDYLRRQKKSVIHGNPHSGNFIVGDSGKLCLIDFEDVCLGDFGLDLEQVLVSVAPEANRFQWYGACMDLRGEKFEKKTVEKYLYSRVFKSAHLFGRCLHFDEGNVGFYYDNLLCSVNDLANYAVDRAAVSKFLDVVKRLEIVVA